MEAPGNSLARTHPARRPPQALVSPSQSRCRANPRYSVRTRSRTQRTFPREPSWSLYRPHLSCVCRKSIRAGERLSACGPRFRASWLCTARERPQRRGRRGMMGDCADATGLPDGGEHVRGPGPPARKRSGEGHRDLGPAPSGRGTRAPAGREEGAPHPLQTGSCWRHCCAG
jgi:hypothetical protein